MLFGADRERVGPCPAKASTIPARISRRQVYLGVAQRLGTEEAGDAGDQRLGRVRLAVTKLAEQVLLGPDDVDAAWLAKLGDDLGEFGE
jgi:hypothetical protein